MLAGLGLVAGFIGASAFLAGVFWPFDSAPTDEPELGCGCASALLLLPATGIAALAWPWIGLVSGCLLAGTGLLVAKIRRRQSSVFDDVSTSPLNLRFVYRNRYGRTSTKELSDWEEDFDYIYGLDEGDQKRKTFRKDRVTYWLSGPDFLTRQAAPSLLAPLRPDRLP